MKIKFFFLFILAVLAFACSQEEVVEAEDENLFITEDATTQSRNGGPICAIELCDPDYVFPTVLPNNMQYRSFTVYFDTRLTAAEIQCVRYEYFRCFPLLRLSLFQSTYIYDEIWRIPVGKPDDQVSNSACNDPRLNQSCGD
jgi:hypothetical protein